MTCTLPAAADDDDNEGDVADGDDEQTKEVTSADADVSDAAVAGDKATTPYSTSSAATATATATSTATVAAATTTSTTTTTNASTANTKTKAIKKKKKRPGTYLVDIPNALSCDIQFAKGCRTQLGKYITFSKDKAGNELVGFETGNVGGRTIKLSLGRFYWHYPKKQPVQFDGSLVTSSFCVSFSFSFLLPFLCYVWVSFCFCAAAHNPVCHPTLTVVAIFGCRSEMHH